MGRSNPSKSGELVQLDRHAFRQAASKTVEWGDSKIIDGVLNGEPAAADALYFRVQDVVVRAVRQVMGGGDSEVEDLTQVAFERIIHSLARGRYARQCSLRTWASLIASRVAIDALRGRKRERNLFDPSAPYTEELNESRDPNATPEQSAEGRRQLTALSAALARMKPEKAQTVFLHDVFGHDLKEIAALMGVSVAAAQSRLVRGRRELLRRYRSTFVTTDKES